MSSNAREEVAALYPHVPACWLPTPPRHAQFGAWVLWLDGCDDAGNFLGWCPMHDKDKETEGSAEFNFHKNIIRCQGDPSCHAGKRAMSLDTVQARMSDVDL